MDVDLIFRIAAVGILVAVLGQLLTRSGRDEQALMTTLAGLIVVLMLIVEQISRIAYLAAITLLVSRKAVGIRSVWLWLSAVFLVLYYIVWIRYFAGGREIALLNRPFLFVPMPLAVFPVLYYLCAAVWLHNIPAVILMTVFGAAHLTVSIRSFG